MSGRVSVQQGKCPGGKCPGCKCPGGKCPRGKCPGGKCPWGKCPGGKCLVDYVLEPMHARTAMSKSQVKTALTCDIYHLSQKSMICSLIEFSFHSIANV